MWLLLHQVHSGEDDLLAAEEGAAGTTMELLVLESEQVHEQALVIRQEEFVEVDRGDNIKEELKDKKVAENVLHFIYSIGYRYVLFLRSRLHVFSMFLLQNCVFYVQVKVNLTLPSGEHILQCLSVCSLVSPAERSVLLSGQ